MSYTSLGKTSLLNEPHIITLQREVENYTRKLEQEKRRLLAIEETYEMVQKEFEENKQKKQELIKRA
jgi:hypothetical protein